MFPSFIEKYIYVKSFILYVLELHYSGSNIPCMSAFRALTIKAGNCGQTTITHYKQLDCVMKNPLDHSYQLIVKALNALVQGIKIDHSYQL
jgi:hypothetical protein